MAISLLVWLELLLDYPDSAFPHSDTPTFRHSDVPTLRLRFPALRSAELSQTFNGLLAPISLYNLCTLMDSLGLYTLFASCSLHVIR